MVGEGKSMVNDVPGLIPRKLFLIDQYSQKFDNSNSRMGIIELNSIFLWEIIPVGVFCLESLDQVSDSGSAEEVLLLQSELFSIFCRIIRVQNTSDVFGSLSVRDGTKVISSVE